MIATAPSCSPRRSRNARSAGSRCASRWLGSTQTWIAGFVFVLAGFSVGLFHLPHYVPAWLNDDLVDTATSLVGAYGLVNLYLTARSMGAGPFAVPLPTAAPAAAPPAHP